MQKFLSLSTLIGAACVASAAYAAPITTLFNTGVNASGAVVANGTVGDLHYSLVSVTLGSTSQSVPEIKAATSASGYPIGPWLGDNTTSRWIGPNTNQLSGITGAVYRYQTTFDLTGTDPLTALISGRWASDDPGYMTLNGQSVGAASASFSTWTNFSINQYFSAGINTLDFYVTNSGGGPTGLRVEMTGTVPEPGSVALAAIALLGLSLATRRRAG